MTRRAAVVMRAFALVAAILAIAAAGSGFRVLQQRAAAAADPLQCGPQLDTAAYERDARLILEKGPLEPPISFRPPGYPLFLAALYRMGFEPRDVPLANAILDGLTALAVALAAYRLSRRPLVALLAALAVAASPTLAYFAGERLETSLMAFFVAVHLVLLVEAVVHGGAARFAFAGMALGAAALVRPNVLLFSPLLALAAFRRARFSGLAAATIGASLLVLPITAKNLIRGGEFILVSGNGGINFWIGNVPDPEFQIGLPYFRHLPGPVPGWPFEKLERRSIAEGGPTLGAQSSWHARRAVEGMAAHPLRTLALFGKKTVAFLNAFELSNNRDIYRPLSPLRALPLAIASWGVLLPLAAVGVASLSRRSSADAPWRWIAYFALAFAASIVLFFVAARHRAPLVPAAALLAARGAVALFPIAAANWRRWALLGASAVLVNVDWLSHRTLYAGYDIDPVGAGAIWQSLGREPEAEAAFALGLERDPDDPLALLKMGSLRNEQGRYAEAEGLLRKSADVDPRRRETWNNLGLALLYERRAGEALDAFDRAVALDPRYALAIVNRGRVRLALGDRAGARADFEAGLALLAAGDPTAARVRELLASID